MRSEESILKKFGLASGVVVVAVLAGCAPSVAPDSSPEPTATPFTSRNLCQSVEDLYIDQFHAVDVKSQFTGVGSVDEPILINSGCEIFSSAEDAFYGDVTIRDASDDPNPIGALANKHVETAVDGETVWVFNQMLDPGYAAPSIYVATIIDGWYGKLWIKPLETKTTDGYLGFTAEDQQAASVYIIDVVRKTVAAQSE